MDNKGQLIAVPIAVWIVGIIGILLFGGFLSFSILVFISDNLIKLVILGIVIFVILRNKAVRKFLSG